MVIINDQNPLLITTNDITYSSVMHDATRRMGTGMSTNTLKIKDLIYEAVYYKSKLIAIRRKDAVYWTRVILNGECVKLPSFIIV